MRYASHLFLRVEPSLPAAVAKAARADGVGSSEFIRRAVRRALSPTSANDDRDPPPPAGQPAEAVERVSRLMRETRSCPVSRICSAERL